MGRWGVLVALLLVAGCTTTVAGHGTPPEAVAPATSAPATIAPPTPAPPTPDPNLPASPCNLVDQHLIAGVLGDGYGMGEMADHCQLFSPEGDRRINLDHRPAISLTTARTLAFAPPHDLTVANHPGFSQQDDTRVMLTVSRSTDPAHPGVLEATITLPGVAPSAQLTLATTLLTLLLPHYP